MVDQPSANEGKPVNLKLTAGGKAAPMGKLASLEIVTAVNRIPRCRAVFFDGDPATRQFDLADGDLFAPGAEVIVSAGYSGAPKPLFKGLVVKAGLEIRRGSAARFVVDMADRALKLTRSRAALVSPGATLASVASAVVGAAKDPKLKTGKLASGAAQEAMVQAYACDWDLLVTLAEASGAVVVVKDGTLDIVAPDPSRKAPLKLAYGADIHECDLTWDATYQVQTSAAAMRAWGYDTQAVVESTPSGTTQSAPGSLDSATLAGVLGVTSRPAWTGAALSADQLSAWADAADLKAQLARVRGRVSFAGHAAAAVGETVDLSRLGSSFSGRGYVSGVAHAFGRNAWTTTVEIGLSPRWFAAEDAAGGGDTALQLPPAPGLQIGQVKKVMTDPKGQHRAFVVFPLFKDTNAEHGVWARLAMPYASKGVGAIFFPEVDDEVLVGFLADDPRAAVIVGGLYSSGRAPAYPATEENPTKAIVTRSKLELSFNDKDVVLRIKTPGGHQFTLSDKDGETRVELKDSFGDMLTMDKDGVTLSSVKDMTLSAKGQMTLTATGELSATADKAMTLTGESLSLTGKSTLSAQASGGQATLKGATVAINGTMVKIN